MEKSEKIESIIELPKFKIRASAIGQIMTEPREKSPLAKYQEALAAIQAKEEKLATIKPHLKTYTNTLEAIEKLKAKLPELEDASHRPHLSGSCKTFLQKWVAEFLYGRRIEFTSKMTDKGNAVEDDAIIYASGYVKGMGLSSKNLKHFDEDEHIIGTPDVLDEDGFVCDIKSAWNHETFPLQAEELPESDYDWQVLGYMAITGYRKGRVIYCLMSMPEEMIVREARWKLGPEYTQEEYEKFAEYYKYDMFPPFMRIKEFEVLWDDDRVAAIRKRVEECRDYINEMILPLIEKNRLKYLDHE